MNIFDLPVHPAADVWPMIDAEGLQQLADDIKANGLLDPIVVGSDEHGELVLIDGRNRLAACKIAHVAPTTTELNGTAPEAFILAKNENRRHMTKGARAMSVARMFPEGQQGKRNDLTSSQNVTKLNHNYISQARAVLKFAPDMAESVSLGSVNLVTAYEQAKARKQAATSDEARLEALRNLSPELADKVVEGELTLPGAEAEHRQREIHAKADRQGWWDALTTLDQHRMIMNTASMDALVEQLDTHGGESTVDVKAVCEQYIEIMTYLRSKL